MNYRTMCVDCAHFQEADPDLDQPMPACTAFPGGIPDEILRLGFDHRRAFPGDGGIRFELAEDGDPRIIEIFDRR